MNVYIYDSFLNQRKFDSILAKIEVRITDLGLNGKIARLGLMKNIRETIENELKRGAKTITVVGNDLIANEALNVLAGKQIPLGIIPIDDGPNNIAKSLGIGFAEKACDILSARRMESLDVVSINNFHFLLDAVIANEGTVAEINDNYSIEAGEEGETRIINLGIKKKGFLTNMKSDPQDGVFELVIRTKPVKKFLSIVKDGGQSVFPLKSLRLMNQKQHPIIIDGVRQIPAPADIKIIKGGLTVIVGRSRIF